MKVYARACVGTVGPSKDEARDGGNTAEKKRVRVYMVTATAIRICRVCGEENSFGNNGTNDDGYHVLLLHHGLLLHRSSARV